MRHRDQNGRVIDIECLDDTHLVNIINYYLRHLQSVKNVIVSGVGSSGDFLSRIATPNEGIIENAKENFQKVVNFIGFYMHEALIRELNIAVQYEILRDLLERRGRRLPCFTPVRPLDPDGDPDGDPDEYPDGDPGW